MIFEALDIDPPSKETTDNIFKDNDKDGDGKINFEEFIPFAKAMLSGS